MLPMPSTMSDYQLTIGSIFEHGVKVHAESEVLTWAGDHARRASFREVGNRVRQFASALHRLGIRPGDAGRQRGRAPALTPGLQA